MHFYLNTFVTFSFFRFHFVAAGSLLANKVIQFTKSSECGDRTETPECPGGGGMMPTVYGNDDRTGTDECDRRGRDHARPSPPNQITGDR